LAAAARELARLGTIRRCLSRREDQPLIPSGGAQYKADTRAPSSDFLENPVVQNGSADDATASFGTSSRALEKRNRLNINEETVGNDPNHKRTHEHVVDAVSA
jgi:hypothetical protein